MTEHQVLRIAEVVQKTGIGKSAIYQAINDGTFPRQFKIGPMRVGWLSEEIDQWILDRAAEREEPGCTN